MINSETFIVKRDGKKEAFSLDKIKNAISKAFLSVGSFATQDVITNILSRVNISDGTSVEKRSCYTDRNIWKTGKYVTSSVS